MEPETVTAVSYTHLLGYLFLKPLLYLFGASDATYPYARDYMLIYLVGTIFVMVSLVMNNFIKSQGFGRIGILTVLCGAVANLVRDPVSGSYTHLDVYKRQV